MYSRGLTVLVGGVCGGEVMEDGRHGAGEAAVARPQEGGERGRHGGVVRHRALGHEAAAPRHQLPSCHARPRPVLQHEAVAGPSIQSFLLQTEANHINCIVL